MATPAGRGSGRPWRASIFRLEKRVRARADSERVLARNACYDAVWTHVRAARHQDRRGGLAHASGSPSEEDAAQNDHPARASEPVSEAGILRRSQPALRGGCGICGGLSSTDTICRYRRQPSCARSFAWRPGAHRATTGWCGTKFISIKWKRRATRRPRASDGVRVGRRNDRDPRFEAGS